MLLWTSGSIEVRIWPNDHCPPHVTAINRADNWTARFDFSMVTDDVSLWSITPKRNAPSQSVIDGVAQQVYQNRQQCRQAWWKYQMHAYGVCLDNIRVSVLPNGEIVLWDPQSSPPPTGTIVAGSGVYIAGQGVRADVKWASQTTSVLLKEV